MYKTSYDSALEDFLLKFESQNTERQKATTVSSLTKSEPTKLYNNDADLKGETLKKKAEYAQQKEGFNKNAAYTGLATGAASTFARMSNLPEDATNDDKEKAAMAGIKDGVASVFPIAGFFKSVEEGGKAAGNKGGAVTGGAVSGFLDPISTIQSDDTTWGEKMIAADPLTAAFIEMKNAKKRAKRKEDEERKLNLAESALEKAKREEEYRMREGLASLENLKNLRQKQLGLIS